MDIPLDEVVYFDVITSDPSTGAAADADSTPTFAVYEESTDTDIGVGDNLTKRTSLDGNYRGTFTASAANGFEVGKWYSVVASATVGSVAGKCIAKTFRIVPAESSAGVAKVDVTHFGGDAGAFTSGVPAVNATHIGGTAQTGRDIGANVLLSSGTGAGQISLSSGTVTVGTNNDKAGYGLADGAITAAKIASDALTAAKFATDFFTGIATAVWGAAARTLTAFSFTPSLHSDYDAAKTAAQPGDEMDLVDAPNETAIEAFATALEAAILDEGDATALLAAIAAKVEEFINNDGDSAATLQAIATAVRSELATELAHVDADISSRSSHSAADVATALGTGSGLTSLATAAELAKVPKSDGSVSWNATAVAAIQNGLATSSALTTVGTNVTTLLNRIGSFTGSGVNTVLGFFLALMKKDASAPSDVGGTFDPETDSAEAIQEEIADIETEVNKIPRAGETHKWKNTATSAEESVEISTP